MEKSREPRSKLAHLWSIVYYKRGGKTMGKKIIPIGGGGKIG